MTDPAERPFPEDHPLLKEPARLDAILDIMWARIQKTVAPTHRPRSRPRSNANLVIAGGVVVEEVLADALAGLLHTEPTSLRTTWEALATTIAHNKAVQAVRDKTKGRRTPDGEIDLRSLDVRDEGGGSLADEIRDELADPEAEAIALQQELIYRRLADQHLTDRDRQIFYRIHYLRQTRAAMCPDYGITAQAVGQIYIKAARKIHDEAQRDPEFLRFSDQERGGNR